MKSKFLARLFIFYWVVLPMLAIAQTEKLSDYDLERRYKSACIVNKETIKDKAGNETSKLNISGEIPNCFLLGLLYTNSTKKLVTGQKNLGKFLIQESCRKGEKAACELLQGGLLARGGSDLLKYGAVIAMGISLLIIANMMFQEEGEYQAQEKLEDGQGKDDIAKHGAILKFSRPFFRRYVTPIVSSLKNKKKIKEKYKRKLATAGLTEVLTPEDFFSFKLFLIVGFPILFLGIRWFLEESWPLSLVVVLGPVGFIYPDIWIKGKAEQRQKEIVRSMPFAVDMLALSVEAGLDFVAAMAKVVEKAKPGPLTWEFEQMMKETKIGASRAEALRNMSWRIDLIQISSFCATLIAADSVGASIGPILKSLSAEIRQKKSAEVEKAGATAATKILFPMLFLIVPAVFIVVAAPIFLEFMRGGG